MREQSTKGKQLGLKEYRVHMGLFDFAVLVVTGDYSKMGEYVAWKNDDEDFLTENFDNGYDCRGKCFGKPTGSSSWCRMHKETGICCGKQVRRRYSSGSPDVSSSGCRTVYRTQLW